MRTFFEWFQDEEVRPDRPWLILGKGPSFSKWKDHDLSGYLRLSLNHAVRELEVAVAHMVDYDVVEACAAAIETNAGVLVLPWRPHVANRPGERTLDELVAASPFLNRLDGQGRLLWYNLSTSRRPQGASPVVRVRYFSAEAALNLLATAGVRTVRSLGIDGGAAYSPRFDDLKDATLLANTWPSFDRQFGEIARTILSTGIDYAPLDVESPIRVFVGSTEDQMLAVRVLEYSIRRHASLTVTVFPLHRARVEVPVPKDPANRPRTPFSFHRFLIPSLAEHRGRAVYLDSDMLVFKDIRGLWTVPFAGADLLTVREPGEGGRRPQFSVMLLNCDTLRWDVREIVAALDRGELDYERLMFEMKVAGTVRDDLDPAWNCLEAYRDGETALLHYTDMPTQPWVSRDNPLGHLWARCLFEAIDAGFLSREDVRRDVERGVVRPSLLYQVDHRIEDARGLPGRAGRLDLDFVPPFRAHAGAGRPGRRRASLSRRLLDLFR